MWSYYSAEQNSRPVVLGCIVCPGRRAVLRCLLDSEHLRILCIRSYTVALYKRHWGSMCLRGCSQRLLLHLFVWYSTIDPSNDEWESLLRTGVHWYRVRGYACSATWADGGDGYSPVVCRLILGCSCIPWSNGAVCPRTAGQYLGFVNEPTVWRIRCAAFSLHQSFRYLGKWGIFSFFIKLNQVRSGVLK